MSSRNLARRTKAEVSFGGIDITKSIQPYLLSISYTDNEEDETDDLQIKIQDRDDLWLTQWLDEISEKLSWASPSGGSASGDAVVSEANKYLGTPYVWGGSSPSGFDCSGLVYYALNEAGINVPRTTAQGYKDMATPVNEATAQPGDLIFFGTQGVVDHVGIYMGNGQMVNAAGSCVQITDINTRRAGIISWGRIGGATQSGSAASAQAGTQSSGSGSSTSSGEQGASSDGGGAEERLAMDVVFVRENWNSDGSDAVLPCGEFELDNISCSGPPNTVCIKGSSIPFSSQLRQTCKSKAWESYTLSGIANEIAGSGGMTCMYESDSDPYYERVEQIDMSDIEFLSQLCHDAGISLKATNRILVLFDQRKYEQKPEVRTIRRYDHSYKTYQLSTSAADAQYASCRVSYVNPETGQCIEGIAKVRDTPKTRTISSLKSPPRLEQWTKRRSLQKRISVFATNSAARHNSCCREIPTSLRASMSRSKAGAATTENTSSSRLSTSWTAAAIQRRSRCAWYWRDIDGRRKSVKAARSRRNCDGHRQCQAKSASEVSGLQYDVRMALCAGHAPAHSSL